jgi:hypothetical protein
MYYPAITTADAFMRRRNNEKQTTGMVQAYNMHI